MSTTGRYYVRQGERVFCVEPVDNGHRESWGDVDPSTGKLTGDYGGKGGSVKSKDSIITEGNGFKNITTLDPGQSPDAYIDALCAAGT